MKIAGRIRLMACGLVIGTALPVAVVEYWGYTKLIESEQLQSLERQVEAEARRLESGLGDIRADVALLAGLPAIASTVEEHLAGRVAEEEVWKERAAHVFAAMLNAHPSYAQARFIGIENGGREIIRVDRGDTGPDRVPETELQEKGSRDYFMKAVGLPLGQIFMSTVTLNRERGAIESASDIRPDDLKRIFAPFTRLQTTTDGSGLGLSVCRRIAERHAGRIWAESAAGYVHIKFSLGGHNDGDSTGDRR